MMTAWDIQEFKNVLTRIAVALERLHDVAAPASAPVERSHQVDAVMVRHAEQVAAAMAATEKKKGIRIDGFK